jgi:hypothetical protein
MNNGTITFVTDRFSKYAVIGVNENINEKPTEGGGCFNTVSPGSISAITLLIGGCWVVMKKKRFC